MTIRVAFVGLGWVIQKIWLPLLNENAACSLIGAVDPDAAAFEQVKDFVSRDSLCRFNDVQELLAACPDLVIVASPNFHHALHAEQLLNAGVSVLVEKPACLNHAEVLRLRAAADRGGAGLFVSHAARYRSDVMALMAVVQTGRIGDIRWMELEWVRACGIPLRGGWFTHAATSGGGVLIDLGWHMLDLGFFFLSQPTVHECLAITSGDFMRQESAVASWRNDRQTTDIFSVDVEDSVVAFLKTTGNVGIKLHLAWASHQNIDVARVVLHGERGSAELRTTFGFSLNRVAVPSLELSVSGHKEAIPFELEPIGLEYRRMLADVVSRYPFISGSQTVFDEIGTLVATIDAIYQSAAKAGAHL
jgi:oxidoreductase